MRSISIIVILAFCVSVQAQTPAALSVIDNTLNVTMGGPAAVGVIPFHSLKLRIAGQPLAKTLLAASVSPNWAGPATFNGVTVGVDVTNMAFIWDGFTTPGAPTVGLSGFVDVPFSIPDVSLMGLTIHVQALTQATGGPLLITNSLDLRFSGEPIVHIASGSQSSHPLTAQGGALAIVSTQTQWVSFWNLHAPGSTRPTMNFATHFVVARFMGNFGYPNVWTSIDDVIRDPSGVLQVFSTQSFGGAPPPPQSTQPFDMVTISIGSFSPTVVETLLTNLYP